LDHAEGDDRAGKCVAVPTGADEWVDVACEIALRGYLERKDEQAKKNYDAHLAQRWLHRIKKIFKMDRIEIL